VSHTQHRAFCTLALAFGSIALPLVSLAADKPPAAPPKPPTMQWDKKRIVDNFNEACAVVDVNKDGKLDIVAGPAWYEGPSWKPHAIREMQPTGVNNEFMTTNGDHPYDLNGDGWVDIISGNWFSDTVHWYENPGKEGLEKAALWKEHLVSKGHDECEGTLFEDLDGDGIPELLIDQWHENHPVTAIRIKPGKDGAMPEFQAFDLGENNGHGMAVGDVNGDGRKDVILQHGWYEAPENRWNGKWKHHPFSKTGATPDDKDGAYHLEHVSLPFLTADLTGDGKADIIVGQGHDYGLMWFEQGPIENGEITWTRHEIDPSVSQFHCLAWADLDGDGKPELITGKRWRAHAENDPGAADPICLFRYMWDGVKKTFTRDTISYNDKIGTGMQINIVDLDGDKRPDIVVAGKAGTYILFNRGPISGHQAAKQ
jgi:hypothetical protein